MQILAEISENETEKLEGCRSGPEPDWRRIATIARQRREEEFWWAEAHPASDLNSKKSGINPGSLGIELEICGAESTEQTS
jgi:hypothetical protein